MKKLIIVSLACLIGMAHAAALTPREVSGMFRGDLNIGGSMYPDKTIYLLPGTVDSTLTFVLPDFSFNNAKLGDIVLTNIPMRDNGQLVLEDATLFIDTIQERALITVVNGLEDEGVVYNSIVTPTEAMVLLTIGAPSLPEPIYVLFQGAAVRSNNYALVNGGFEGVWTNEEPQGWHSFNSATGLLVDFIKKPDQFRQSTDIRPGSAGLHSALIASEMALGVKANGNCTNGQINAGSMTADDAAGNYNFSDPTNEGFNTPFQGRPDSLIFWAKYLPADRDASNPVNQARLNAVITTNARYQDPEADVSYDEVKIGTATINYSANAQMSWQRFAVPFEYVSANQAKMPAFILVTFTTNKQPGGGSSYSTGTVNKVNVLDTVYLDDVSVNYNRGLSRFTRDEEALDFEDQIASVDEEYCDSCADNRAYGNGVSARTFIGWDAIHRCMYVYVVADDFAQSGRYTIYRVEFTDSDTDDLNPLEPEGLERVYTDETKVEKVFVNGRLLIRRGNDWYSVTGVRVK